MNDTPIIYCDGIHDDADALQAWLDGSQVVFSNGEPFDGKIPGTVFIGEGKTISADSRLWDK